MNNEIMKLKINKENKQTNKIKVKQTKELMNQDLNVLGWTIPMEDIWGQFTTVPLFLILFLFPLVNLRKLSILSVFLFLKKLLA